MSKYVIVGGVAAGATAAARIRRLDERAEIIVLERGGYVSFANCGLPYYIGGIIEDREDLTLQTPESFRSRYNVDVRVHSEALCIDRAAKTVTVRDTESGRQYEESYDRLLLAPGAAASVPPLPGVSSERVFTLRSLEDCFRIKDYTDAAKPSRAAVIGGGFIGLEAAENLAALGIRTSVLCRGTQVLPPMDGDMAAELHAHILDKGVDLRFRQSVTGFEETEKGIRVLLGGSEPLETDMVLLAVGVAPDSKLARDAGLELGLRGSILTDSHMRTSDPCIYAAGDAVQVQNLVTGDAALIPLAGPANKQGRIAADNICGIESEYKGTQGSSVAKIFDMTAASTGINEKTAKAAGIAYDKVINYSASHAGYYPGGESMTIKTLFDPQSGRILGAQITGFDGVDKRIDVLATAIRAGMTAADLTELELAYAPPYSSAKDPVNMVGYTIENILAGLVRQWHWHDAASLPRDGSVTLLDVRGAGEYSGGHIPGAVNIPLPQLRERCGELDKSKTIYVNCYSGMRSYVACRILSGLGFDCRNLSGGWRFYELATRGCADNEHFPCGERR